MVPNLLKLISQKEFLSIPAKISNVQEFIDKVIPKGFEDILLVSHNTYEVFIQTLSEDGSTDSYEINISPTIFNADYPFPTFIFTDLTTNLGVFNQNQLLHLMLVYRFNQFKPMKRPYLNFITRDIASIMRYIQYVTPTSYNSKKKNENLNVFISYESISNLSESFSEVFFNNNISEGKWSKILDDNPMIVSSIGTMSRSSSIVLKQDQSKQVYRSPGYKELPEGFISIFPPKQNVPARLQTHLLGNAFSLSNSSQSIIQQDNIIDYDDLGRRALKPKDSCLREAIIVYHPTEESGRFLGGEIEIDNSIANELLQVNNNLEDCFSEINVEEGKTYYPNFKDFTLGISLTGQYIVLRNFKEFTIKSIEITGINSSRKIRISGYKHAGNCRITSNTGLKGVTKVVNNLGNIELHHSNIEPLETSFEDDFTLGFQQSLEQSVITTDLQERYPNIDINSLDDYPLVRTNHDSIVFKTLSPDLICGMNSVKAKSNTIVLSRACLAVKLGYYIPSEKLGFKGILNSLDEDEINAAADSLPAYTYRNKDGVIVEVEIGLIYISYTEICDIYTKIKPQSFSFESGRALALNSNSTKDVYKHIWDNYLEEDKVEASLELYKILTLSQTGVFNNDENLPVYTLDDINNIFNQNDLILQKRNQFSSDSKLLDEDFNKGFIIDLSKYPSAPVIRIPSAKTLKIYSGVLNNGDVIYHVNLINASKIIRGCLKIDNNYSLNTIYSKDKSRTTSALSYNAYINTVRSTIYSGEETSQQMIQSLVKPKIMGCSLKQVSEYLLPEHTVVITDDKLYRKLKEESLVKSGNKIEEHEINLILLLSQYSFSSKQEQRQLFEELDKDSPLALGIRSPSLWLTQNIRIKIWDRHMYDLYLNLNYDLNIDSVLNPKFNKDVVLIDLKTMIWQHSDVDGDLFPIFVPNYEGQQLLKDFKLEKVLDEELEWHESYRNKEFSSTMDLQVAHKYQLHYLSYKDYSNFLINAVVAKNNIGVSTLDIWSFSMILEVYQQYCKDNNYTYQKKDVTTALTRITPHEAQLLGYTYTRLVQEMVIEGIKHTENGSKDFDIYFLKSIGKMENEKKIRSDLSSVFGLSQSLIDKLLFIIRFAEDNNDLSKACRNFISMYNKGRFPADDEALNYWEEYIANNTYFGSLLKVLFDIKQSYQTQAEDDFQDIESLFNSEEEFVFDFNGI